MKCIQCKQEIEDGQTIIPMSIVPPGNFVCGLVCKCAYEKKQDKPLDSEYLLSNYPHFLMPTMLKDGKMFLWYSICSKHRSHDAECHLCQAGSWQQIKRVKSQEEIDQFGGGKYADS